VPSYTAPLQRQRTSRADKRSHFAVDNYLSIRAFESEEQVATSWRRFTILHKLAVSEPVLF